jgi:NAD(P)-dependent dehydrogenase (short-subunit alcohol dehydrogenase family)
VRLTNKVALITGGGTGIGRACAELFAREGAAVVVSGRRSEPLQEVQRAIAAAGGRALAHSCDVSRVADVEGLIAHAVKEFGALSVVVNNAGLWMAATAEETSEADWDALMNVNLKGVFLVSRAAIPVLRRAGGGSIINIGSILGLVGMKRRVAYAASKGGVTLLTKAMALDLGSDNIRVNCICPGIVETGMVRDVLGQSPDPEVERRRRIEQLAVGRIGQPEDVAHLALYLASDESAWMTGAAIPLDAGFTAA